MAENIEKGNEDELMAKSEFFRHDNAIYRKRPGNNAAAVDEVLHGDKWVPYKGDRSAPALFGSKIAPARILKMLKH